LPLVWRLRLPQAEREGPNEASRNAGEGSAAPGRARIEPVPRSLRRAIVRTLRRAAFHLQGRRLPLVYDPRYEQGVFGVPLDPLRGEKILASLRERGVLAEDGVSTPRPASLANLLRVHTEDYLRRLEDPQTVTRILGVTVTPREAEAVVDQQRLTVGGTIQATRLALRTGGVTVHLGGGLHHAMPDAGHGFCVFNDVAVAIRRLRARGFEDPVLVVDLDLHDGNGTRAIFADDPSVHTYSLHNQHWGETAAVGSTAIALGAGVGDERYLGVLRETLPPLVASFRPGLVVYLAGTDSAEGDALGDWRLSAAGLLARDRIVTSLVRGEGTTSPMVVLLAGGYGRHAWRYSARYLLWLSSGREVEPPEEEALALRRFRRLGQALRGDEREDDRRPFSLTEEDLAGLVPGLSSPPRFLGYLTRHAVELLLESSGILAQLRARGYRRLRVDLEARSGLAHTLRVVSDEGADEVLVELRAERSRGAVPGMETILLEWLLLQNPRGEFSLRRPRLPGQQHPGLGLLRDIMGWLVVVCEERGLDGIFFTAAHYHIAMQSRRLVRPLDPVDEARLEGFAAALSGLSLADATAAVAEGRVLDTRTGAPAEWTPIPTVLPVSERLRDRVTGPTYEAAVSREQAHFSFRLASSTLAPGDP
jgi:acetoin utilization deacetylase AcuC-like enzyme